MNEIQKLNLKIRRLEGAIFVMAITFSSIIFFSFTVTNSSNIGRFHKLEIVSPDGQVRYRLDTEGNNVWQEFFDHEDNKRIEIGISSANHSKVRLYDESQKYKYVASANSSSSENAFCGYGVFKANAPIIVEGTQDDNSSFKEHYDFSGVRRFEQYINKNNIAQFRINGPNKEVFSIYSDENDLRQVFNDSKGNSRLQLGLNRNDNLSFLTLESSDSKAIEIIGAPSSVEQIFFNKYGHNRMAFGISNDSKSYLQQNRNNQTLNFGIMTNSDGSFSSYAFQTDEEKLFDAASALSTIKTFYDIIK